MYVSSDNINYMVENITKKKGTPFQMGREELADACFPHVKAQFPEAKLFKVGTSQYITITKRAQNSLIKKLNERKKEHEKTIKEYEKMIRQIEDAVFILEGER